MALACVVLVHGLYHQPDHWLPLEQVLRRCGACVHVPRLHRGSLALDTEAVQAVVDGCETSPVVVGHSYGGAVITGVRHARRLVYLAAFVPDAGESCASIGGARALVNRWVQQRPGGGTFISADVAGQVFYGDCDAADTVRAVALLVPQAPGHGRARPDYVAWKETESLYVICSQDQALDPALQRDIARRCTAQIELPASHSPYISMPAAIASLIIGDPHEHHHDGGRPAPKSHQHADRRPVATTTPRAW